MCDCAATICSISFRFINIYFDNDLPLVISSSASANVCSLHFHILIELNLPTYLGYEINSFFRFSDLHQLKHTQVSYAHEGLRLLELHRIIWY